MCACEKFLILTDNLAHIHFLSGVRWVHTAQITRVRTVASALIAWMALFVSVKQVFKETGKVILGLRL